MKKWITPVCFEIVGAVILLAGIIYDIFFSRLPFSENPAQESFQSCVFHHHVGAVIMLTGKILVLSGLFFLYVKIITEMFKTNTFETEVQSSQSESKMRSLRILKFMSLLIFVLIPFIFNILYQPVNENVIIEYFGCGCPKLGLKINFNANDFNAVVWGIILFILVTMWAKTANTIRSNKIRQWTTILGMFALTIYCLRFYARMFWL